MSVSCTGEKKALVMKMSDSGKAEKPMQSCELCEDCIFLVVVATKYGGDPLDTYLRPTSFQELARFCPRCGRPLKNYEHKIGGTD